MQTVLQTIYFPSQGLKIKTLGKMNNEYFGENKKSCFNSNKQSAISTF